jgi:cation transport ATPase
MIPMDGKIISGDTTVDEAAITGEPIAKDKHTGDTVFAGTLNKNGFIEIETTKTSADTTFSKMFVSHSRLRPTSRRRRNSSKNSPNTIRHR